MTYVPGGSAKVALGRIVVAFAVATKEKDCDTSISLVGHALSYDRTSSSLDIPLYCVFLSAAALSEST